MRDQHSHVVATLAETPQQSAAPGRAQMPRARIAIGERTDDGDRLGHHDLGEALAALRRPQALLCSRPLPQSLIDRPFLQSEALHAEVYIPRSHHFPSICQIIPPWQEGPPLLIFPSFRFFISLQWIPGGMSHRLQRMFLTALIRGQSSGSRSASRSVRYGRFFPSADAPEAITGQSTNGHRCGVIR
jgi:hypothetical protein